MTSIFRPAVVIFSTIAIFLAPLAAPGAPLPGASQEAARGIHSTGDVLVVGGTPAGVAAALAAARRGLDVTLVSADADLGGILTDAMMDQWDLNLTPGGESVEGGIFAQIYGRLGEGFTPRAAARVFAELVAKEPRIRVRYHEAPVGVATSATENGVRVDDVAFRDTRTGSAVTLEAPLVVDATDSGDVAAMAGARYDIGRQDSGLDERMQAVTLMFTLTGVDWSEVASSYDARRFGPGGSIGRTAWGYEHFMRRYRPLFANVVVRDLNLGLLPDGDVTVNAVDVCGIDGRDPRQVETARLETELEASHLVGFLRSRLPGFGDARVGRFAPEVYVRETRHVDGLERLTTEDVWRGRIPADSIGLASYPIDIHPVDPTDEPAFAPMRHVYGIPFGAMVPKGLANVVLAGPAISASHLASGSARIIPTTIEEGEAAGAACALALRDRLSFPQLALEPRRVATLRGELAESGVMLDSPDRPMLHLAKL